MAAILLQHAKIVLKEMESHIVMAIVVGTEELPPAPYTVSSTQFNLILYITFLWSGKKYGLGMCDPMLS